MPVATLECDEPSRFEPITMPKFHLYLIPTTISIISVIISLLASAHVVLYKRDTKAAIGWIGLIWLSPFLGTAIYVVFGINRIRRRAQAIRQGFVRPSHRPHTSTWVPESLAEHLHPYGAHLVGLIELVGKTTHRPLLAGNAIRPLVEGDQAYPAMIEAIDGATQSVALCSYIFNDDRAGRLFVDALGRAVHRGVEVRVLVDDLGARYDSPRIMRPLRRAGVDVATFMPTLAPGYVSYLNLRDHRKILVVDGQVGFTGGMNIDEAFFHSLQPSRPKMDLHFQVLGPVVASLQQVFVDDWSFCTGEQLQGEIWFPRIEPSGDILARGIADGPDEDIDKLQLALMGALSSAQSTVAIITPYFLPDPALVWALNVAAMRGVQVDILLPLANNLKLVHWASMSVISQVLERGCRVWFSPPPFDHTKLMIVDRTWSFIGSANWDPRSLRLNFEYNLECYGSSLASCLDELFCDKLRQARPFTLDEIKGRSLPVQLRDGVARLLSPYL